MTSERDVNIRIATTEDLDELAALVSDKLVADPISNGVVLVAEVDDRIIGYASVENTFFERSFVTTLYVDQPHRRSGAGSRLMQEAIAHATTDRVFTSTNQSNQPMRHLLAKDG